MKWNIYGDKYFYILLEYHDGIRMRDQLRDEGIYSTFDADALEEDDNLWKLIVRKEDIINEFRKTTKSMVEEKSKEGGF
jgi:hypothetical protein